jgi:nucleoside-diphosphate-sugar epimerase
MRVLIVGYGYVGEALGSELSKQGHEVIGLRRNIGIAQEPRSNAVRLVSADITQPNEPFGLEGGYDWVVHCVSATGGGVADYRRVYVEGTRNLLRSLATDPPRAFVYTSSTSVYGQSDGSWVNEASPTEPGADTAKVLLEAEKLLLEEEFSRWLQPIILRVAGIYGPGRGYWLKQFLQGEARLEGRGERILNMIHRDDVAKAIVAALQLGRSGETYNVVDDEPVSQLHCFQWVAQRLGRSLPPSTSELPDRKRGFTNKRISNRRLRNELKCHLAYPTFREGFEAEIERLAVI